MVRWRDVPYWFLVSLVIVILFMGLMHKAARASATDGTHSLPWTCEQVRQFMANATPSEIAAVANRLSREQRRQARACLKEKP